MQRKDLFNAKMCFSFLLTLGRGDQDLAFNSLQPSLQINLPFVIIDGKLNLQVQQVKSHKLEQRKTAERLWETTYRIKQPQSRGAVLEYHNLEHLSPRALVGDACVHAGVCARLCISYRDQYLRLQVSKKRRIFQFVSSGKCNFPPNTH